ncbi:MAG: DNA adenine methylase [Candidatus Zixiibacteriota bacterium]
MTQYALFPEDRNAVVNVAKVPQRSPFRYPGGKTWLVPRIRLWMHSLSLRPADFIEPFAGGGIVGLTIAFENYADHVTFVERDEQVAAVWGTILGSDGRWLADAVASFDLSYESARKVIDSRPRSNRQLAFQTILKNRIYHGGILADGSGMLKNGENGRGIYSRWYPDTLKKRILAIQAVKERIDFIEGDGIEVMKRNSRRTDVVYFIDPPYTAGGKRAGRRLYRYSEVDHAELFRVARQVKGDCLLTYDDAPEVRELAIRYDFEIKLVAMKNTHHAKMTELLIGKDLSWIP